MLGTLHHLGNGKPGILNAAADYLREARDYCRRRTATHNADWKANVLSLGPHPPGFYFQLIAQWNASGQIRFLKAGDLAKGRGAADKVNLVLRHDLDAQPEKVVGFVESERKLDPQLRSSIYVRVDRKDYEPESIALLIRNLHKEGFEIGLHSFAHGLPHSFYALQEEVHVFNQAFGFLPDSVNTHGISGASFVTRIRRKRFIYSVAAMGGVQGIPLIDHNQSDAYSYLAGDSNKGKNGINYITRDLLEIPKLVPGSRVLFTTHPEYWTAGS